MVVLWQAGCCAIAESAAGHCHKRCFDVQRAVFHIALEIYGFVQYMHVYIHCVDRRFPCPRSTHLNPHAKPSFFATIKARLSVSQLILSCRVIGS